MGAAKLTPQAYNKKKAVTTCVTAFFPITK